MNFPLVDGWNVNGAEANLSAEWFCGGEFKQEKRRKIVCTAKLTNLRGFLLALALRMCLMASAERFH